MTGLNPNRTILLVIDLQSDFFVLSDLIGTQDERMDMTSVLLDAVSYMSHVMTSDQLLEELA